MKLTGCGTLALILSLSVCGSLLADDTPAAARRGRAAEEAAGAGKERDNAKPAKKPKAAKRKLVKAPPVNAERESAAMAFVALHHPALSELLVPLKDSNPQEYALAIQDLSRISSRLAQLQKRNPRHYELQLEVWKVNSRVRLLAARLTMAADPALEQQLREALAERKSRKLELLEFERKEAAARLEKIDSSIAALHKWDEADVDRELEKVLRGIGRARSAADSRPAAPRKRPKPDRPAEGSEAPASRTGNATSP